MAVQTMWNKEGYGSGKYFFKMDIFFRLKIYYCRKPFKVSSVWKNKASEAFKTYAYFYFNSVLW